MKQNVSVIICTYNDEKYLRECIESILNQTYEDFELIIVNDGSTDGTNSIIKSYKDKRIKYYNLKKNSGSIGKIRRYSTSKANGKFILFTDGDCYPKNDWIEKTIAEFNHDCVAVEGKVVYYKNNYRPTLSDRKVQNLNGGQFKTANMAYRREIFSSLNFNKDYTGMEDREFALNIINNFKYKSKRLISNLNSKNIEKIYFSKQSIVYHAKKVRSIIGFIRESEILTQKIQLIKKYNDTTGNRFRILEPKFLFVLIFPPAILAEIYLGKIRSWQDVILLPFVYIKAIYMRYIIWKTAIKERVFVI